MGKELEKIRLRKNLFKIPVLDLRMEDVKEAYSMGIINKREESRFIKRMAAYRKSFR